MYPNALLVFGCASIALAHHIPPQSSVTAAPDPAIVELRLRQAKPPPNPISLAKVLLTAFPPSLIAIAATDPATIPIILWSEFLDGSTPAWFAGLPDDIRTYLSEAYVGLTAPPALASTTPIEFPPTPTPSEFDSAAITASPQSLDTLSAPSYSDPPASSTDTPYSADSSTETTLETSTASEQSTASTESPSTLPTETPAPSESETQKPKSSGLSKSSKIGIGVGVPFGVVAIAALIGSCLLCRRRRARCIDEKDDDSDTAAFMTPAQLYGDHRGGPYDSASNLDFGPPSGMAGGAVAPRRLSLPPINTDPFRDPLPEPSLPYNNWEASDSPVGAGVAGYSNHKSSPVRSKRRRSGASLRSIEEVDDEDGDIAGATSRRSWSRRRSENGQLVSPLLPHDPMEPPFPKEPENAAGFSTFRGGSLKQNRRCSGPQPSEEPPFIDSHGFAGLPAAHTIPRKEIARKSSQTIGGGYRNLPSPHLQSPTSPTYILPPGEWLEDGEDLPATTNGYRK